jgi:segregation and condensation protein B
MENLELQNKIESILFWKGEPVKFTDLCSILDIKEKDLISALESLSRALNNRGVSIITEDNKVVMTTSSSSSEIIEKLQKEELTKDLSKAALETLSIIVYRGPLKRSQIDYIRGVNSQFSLRTLLIRGLIEKKNDPNDERAYIYKSSLELLSHMSIQKISDLPQYAEVNADIDNFLNSDNEDE